MGWSEQDIALLSAGVQGSWSQIRATFHIMAGAVGLAGGEPRQRIPIAQAHTGLFLGMICAAWDHDIVPALMNHRWPLDLQKAIYKRFRSQGPVFLDWGRKSETGVVVLPGDKHRLRKDMPVEAIEEMVRSQIPKNLPAPFFSRTDDAEALIVFTSGSTGEPRAAVHSFHTLSSAADASNRAIPLARGDRWLLSLPLYHVGGIGVVMRCARAGATIVIPEATETLAESLERYAPTYVSLVATQLYRLLHDEKSAIALARCKAVVMGGGPTPESLMQEALARGIKLVMSYGMTETAAMICCTRPGDSADRLLSSGKPLAEDTVSISSDGEILVRGDQLFLGYLQPDGSLHRPLTDDGWFRTGDLGHFDEAGYLHITGRRDNMFISGGENIQPEEIEQALRNLDGVEEAIVVPVDSAEWGKRPVAFVRMYDDRPPNSAEIETSLRNALPGYKIPRAIHAWPMDLAQPGIKPARKDFEKRAKESATDQTD